MENKSITYDEYQKALKVVHQYQAQLKAHSKMVNKEIDAISKFSQFSQVTKETIFLNIDCSARLKNLLCFHSRELLGFRIDRETKVEDLSGLSISRFSKSRKVGERSAQELKEIFTYAGIDLIP